MTTVDTGTPDWPLLPPPEVILARPLRVRLLARAASGLWWSAGLLAAGSAGLIVADPVLLRPIVARLVGAGLACFVVAVAVSVLVSRMTAVALDREIAAREEAERAAEIAGRFESAVLDAVAEETAARDEADRRAEERRAADLAGGHGFIPAARQDPDAGRRPAPGDGTHEGLRRP